MKATKEIYKSSVRGGNWQWTSQVEESQYIPEDEFLEEEEKPKEQKQQVPKRKNEVFDYLNKDAKRNKQ